MLFTKASEYALMSMMLIAKSEGPQDTETLARMLGISKSFLAKILQGMAREGILKSFKGAKGGFALARKPDEISVLDIVAAMDGKSAAVFECSSALADCPGGEGKATLCSIWPFLNRLQGKVDTFLAEVSLADLIQE